MTLAELAASTASRARVSSSLYIRLCRSASARLERARAHARSELTVQLPLHCSAVRAPVPQLPRHQSDRESCQSEGDMGVRALSPYSS